MSLPVVADSVQSYLAEVGRYPVLSAAEEYEIAERYYRERGVEDAHRLVTSNLRYVVKIALEYRHYGAKLADLIQEGNIGLMVAVKKFNPYKGFRLITYATWWIKSRIQEFILKSRGLVRHGTKALKKKLFYKSGPAAAEADDSSALALRNSGFDLSLDAAVGDDSTTHLELLADSAPGSEDLVSADEETSLVKDEVTTALACLNDRERMVVEKRLMTDDPTSLAGLGEHLGVTRERVRQIEGQALKKLRKALEGKPGAMAALVDGLAEPA